MKKLKSILSLALIFVLVLGGSVLLGGCNDKKEPKAYGVEHKMLESEITTVSYTQNGNNPYFTIEWDFKLSLLNTTNKEYVYNTDVLYLEIDASTNDVPTGGRYYVTFINREKIMCFSDVIGADDMVSIIPANNAINSLSGTIDLRLYYDAGPNYGGKFWGHDDFVNMLNETMSNAKFRLKYNGIKVAEFKPEAKITSISGLEN